MRKFLIGLVCSLMLTASVAAHEHDPETAYCLESPGRHWTLHIVHGSGGDRALFGHVHTLALPKEHPCYTQFVLGSAKVYPEGHPTQANLADGVVYSPDVMCPVLVARIRGRIDTSPIVYTGLAQVGRATRYIEVTLLPDCSTHP
jgi:hypothetical protein